MLIKQLEALSEYHRTQAVKSSGWYIPIHANNEYTETVILFSRRLVGIPKQNLRHKGPHLLLDRCI